MSKTLLITFYLSVVLCASPTLGSQETGGSIIGWGSNVVGVDMTGPFISISAGEQHSLALYADGSIAAWGLNSYGICRVPVHNSNYLQASSGSSAVHSLAIRSDGSIDAWGNNNFGQIDVPAPNTGFMAVSAGNWHSIALKPTAQS